MDMAVIRLEGRDHIEPVILDNGRELRLDAPDNCSQVNAGEHTGIVVFTVGMRTEVGLAEDKGVEIGKDGIIVDEKMETSRAGVYAVGDTVPGELATNAIRMAKVLGGQIVSRE